MGIRSKFILAASLGTVFLMTPEIVHADDIDASQTQSVSTTNEPSNTESSNSATPINNNEIKTEGNGNDQTPSGNNDQNQTVTSQQGQITQTSQNNQSEPITNDTNNSSDVTTQQSQYSDESIDGIFHVNGSTAYLYQGDGQQVDNRALGANTPWMTDVKRTWNDGTIYYRVSTNEYVKETSGYFDNNVKEYSGTASVTYDSDVQLFQGYGKNAVYAGSTVSPNSAWKIDKRVSNGGEYWYEVGNNVWLPQSSVVVNDSTYPAANWVAGVPMISQRPELPNGCEITAVTMMLQYAGANVNKMQLAYEMPRSSNPNYGYMGQPWDNTGVTIFPPALMRLVEKYAGSAKNLTGQGLDAIKYQISIGHPVVTWNTLHGFPYHALTVTGYDSNYIYYNDCWLNQPMQMDINQFLANWNTQDRRAISY